MRDQHTTAMTGARNRTCLLRSCLLQSRVARDRLCVIKLAPDAAGVAIKVMREVVRHAQMRRQRVIRHRDELACPAGSLSDDLRPFQLAQCLRVADVVSATGGTLIGCRKRDGRGDVFDVAARPAPRGAPLAHEDGAATVIHALQVFKGAVLMIARAVNERQTQHGARQLRIAHHHLLDQYLVVFVNPLAEPFGKLTVGITRLAQRRVFRKRRGRGFFQPDEATISAIHILARSDDHAPRQAAERLHQAFGFGLVIADQIDDHFGCQPLQVTLHKLQRMTVATKRSHLGGQRCALAPAVHHGNLMTAGRKLPDDRRADESCAANDENLHSSEL